MRTLGTFTLTMILGMPSLTVAEDQGILASAKRLAAAEGAAQQIEVGGTRRSATRVAIGLALAGAGAAMLLIDPKQPVQPSVVSPETMTREFFDLINSDAFIQDLVETSPPTHRSRQADLDDMLLETRAIALFNGVGAGGLAARAVVTSGNRTVYADSFSPFEERSAGLKYGGAALAIAGAAVAGFWSQVPVMNQLTVAPTHGGVRVGSSIGF